MDGVRFDLVYALGAVEHEILRIGRDECSTRKRAHADSESQLRPSRSLYSPTEAPLTTSTKRQRSITRIGLPPVRFQSSFMNAPEVMEAS